MAKYIIETDGNTADGISGYLGIRIEICNKRTWVKTDIELTPYTKPDMEQIKREAYQQGLNDANYAIADDSYKKGLSDAWNAARKIWEYDTTTLREIFGEGIMRMDWFMKFTATEAIEKIRQYEQEKEKKDGVWIASETWIMSEANEPSVDTTLICSKCGYEIKIKPHETPALNFCPKCGDCKKPKEEES